MKLKQLCTLCSCIALSSLFSSCEDKNELIDNRVPQNYIIGGSIAKGPFAIGSAIKIQEMSLKPIDPEEYYTTNTLSNTGSYAINSIALKSPYAEINANGRFYNEISGELSDRSINLKALTDLSLNEGNNGNVNILTHLKYQRILTLMSKEMSFTDANKQAQDEIFSSFGLQKYSTTDASSLSISENAEESAILIAISSLLLNNKNEDQFSYYLSNLCSEFGKYGHFTDETRNKINADKKDLLIKLPSIKENIIAYYTNEGSSAQVKELFAFIDWDNDGIAGNETLQEGEEVILESTQINAPIEGGTYKIKVTSPAPLSLSNPLSNNGDLIPNIPADLYENVSIEDLKIKSQLQNNEITITIPSIKSRKLRSLDLFLYDMSGKEVGKVNITQKGDANMPNQKLGKSGKSIVNMIVDRVSKGFSSMNFIMQKYHLNTPPYLLNAIYPHDTDVLAAWNNFYQTNFQNLFFKKLDSQNLNWYQDNFNVLSALHYYHMVTTWGDIPYIDDYSWYSNSNLNEGKERTNANVVLNKLKENLEAAIPYLEDKKNESLTDENSFLFMSKDVARILLADIYMYQNDYTSAAPLLASVIKNDFYSLDASDYSNKETVENLINGKSSEIIFILNCRNSENRGSKVIPVMTYTDVILSYSECLYKNGDLQQAKAYLDLIATAKGIAVSGDILTAIKDIRMKILLYGVSNFAFLKRNNLAEEVYGIEKYKLLLPIPAYEIETNPKITQNPGY